MAASGFSGGAHKRHRKPKPTPAPTEHRPYGGGHKAPSGNVPVHVKRHQKSINKVARKATHTKKFKQAKRHPAKSDYAKQYAKPIAREAKRQARRIAHGSGVSRTLAAKSPHIPTGLSSKAEKQAKTALAPTRPHVSVANIKSDIAGAVKFAGADPQSIGLGDTSGSAGISRVTHSGAINPGRSATQTLEDIGTAALIVGGPEAGGALTRLAARGIKAARGGEKVAAEGARVAEAIPKKAPKAKLPEPDKPVGRVKRTAKRAKTYPKRRINRAAKKPVLSRAKGSKTRAGLGAFALAPPTHGTGPGQRVSALVKGHENAVFHHPLETAATTARVAEGIPGALLAIPAAAYTSAKHGTTKPLQALADQQVSYVHQVGDLFSGNTKKVERTVANKVGLVPAVSAALGTGAGVRFARRIVKPKEATPFGEMAKLDSRTRKLARDAQHAPTRAARKEARDKLEQAAPEGRVSTTKGHIREAQRAGVREQRRIGHAHREHKILDKHLNKVARKRVGDISELDIVQYLGRHGYGPDTHHLIEHIQRDRAGLKDATRDIHPDEVHTRHVIDTILANPEVLGHDRIWHAIDALGKVQHARGIERHEIATGQPQTTPLPRDERARTLTQMRAEDVRTREERIPPELQGKTRIKEKVGRDAERHIRHSAKRMQTQARKLRAAATELRKAGNAKRADKLERRAAKTEAKATERLSVVDRFKRAEKLDRIAAKLEAGHALTDQENAFLHGDPRAEAASLREAGQASQAEREMAAADELAGRQKAEGLRQPIYFKQSDLGRTSGEMNVAGNFPGGRVGKKERFKSGTLEQQGRVDESATTMMANLEHQRVVLAHDRTAIDALGENATHVGAQRFLTGDEIRSLRRDGKIPRGYEPVPVQEFAGPIQRNDALRSEYEQAQLRVEATQQTGNRKLYMLWKSSRREEYHAQLESLGRVGSLTRGVFRAQTGLMLGTSPTWFLFQLPATPLGILARNWSPARYARATASAIDVWKNASPRVKAEFDAHIGGNSGNVLEVGNVTTDVRPTTVRGMHDAAKMAFRTPVGRFLHKSLDNLKAGGPLIRMNRAYEAKIRRFAALMEMDRATGLTHGGRPTASAGVVRFIDRTGRTTNSIYALQEKLMGMKPHERVAYLNNHAEGMRVIEKGINDSLGEWVSLTKAERNLASVVVFYPFVRYSLRWLFYAFPKENPLKAAVMMNMAQSNDIELQKILGGKPDLIQAFGGIVTYNAEGKPQTALNLARSSPGGNSVIEAIGGGKFDLATILKPIQPLAGSALLASADKTAFGTDAKGTAGEQFLNSVFALSPLTRSGGPLEAHVGPGQSDLGKLFEVLGNRPSPLVPQTTFDLRKQAELVKLEQLTKTAFQEPANLNSLSDVPKFFPKSQFKKGRAIVKAKDKAWAEIDAMMRRYGIQTAAEQKRNLKSATRNYSSYSKQYGLFGTEPQQKDTGGGLFGGKAGPLFKSGGGGGDVFKSGSGQSLFK